MVKKLSDLYIEARRALATKEDPQSASLLARNLICHLTGMTQEQLLADRELLASEKLCLDVSRAVQRLLNGEPIAYVINQWDFYGMRLRVTKDVLIPRDDTCTVTGMAINKAIFLNEAPRILDLCTGSGCIGLAVAHRVKDARVTLADISREALAVAKSNIVDQKLSARVSCVQVDAHQPAPAFLGKFDMIISNPPYITEAEMETLDRSVKDFEPHLALCGGKDGLDFYHAIARNFSQALKNGGYLCFEFGRGQGDAVCEILVSNGYTILERSRDNNHIERAVLAQYSGKEE